MWGWGWHGMMRGPWILGGLLMFLFWIAVIALVIWLIVRLVRSTSRGPAQSSPQPQLAQPDPVLDTLRRRLAEGAITSQEFDELRQKLGV
jgi:putative membrane protein